MAGGVDMLDAQKLSHEREARAFSDIAVLCRTHRQLELIESCLRHDDIPCIVSGRESWLENDNVRGFLCLLPLAAAAGRRSGAGNSAAPCVAVPARLFIQQAQRACARQNWLDLTALRQALPEGGHAGQWLACAETWLAAAKTEKPWKLAERWAQEHGTCDAMEKLQHRLCSTHRCLRCWTRLPLGRRQIFAALQAKGWQAGCAADDVARRQRAGNSLRCSLRGLVVPCRWRPRDARQMWKKNAGCFYVGITRAKEELILTTGPHPSAFLQSLPRTVARESAARLTRQVEQLSLFEWCIENKLRCKQRMPAAECRGRSA